MRGRLEDQIRELCAKAIATDDSAQLQKVIENLRIAIHEHTNRVQNWPSVRFPQIAELASDFQFALRLRNGVEMLTVGP